MPPPMLKYRLMGTKINPADIAPGYSFNVDFRAPAAEVAAAPFVRDTVENRLGIPQDHYLEMGELPPADKQDPRLTRYLGCVSFMDFDAEAESPPTMKADIHVNVYGPRLTVRALARVFRFRPKAKVWASGEGARPFGGNGGVRREPSPDIDPIGPLVYA